MAKKKAKNLEKNSENNKALLVEDPKDKALVVEEANDKALVVEKPEDKAIVEQEAKDQEIMQSNNQAVGQSGGQAVGQSGDPDDTKASAEKDNPQPATDSPSDASAKADNQSPATGNRQPATVKGHWYVIHTYSGHENKAAEALKQRVAAMNLSAKIYEVVVPTRNIVVVRHGKKSETKEKIFPGYMLVRMELDDQSWLAVRTTQGVTAFVGMGNKPTPISDKEVKAIMKFMELEAPRFKAKFSKSEAVKIVDGPFADFLGTIETIDEAKGKVKVLVSIFGRETPVELDFLQIRKL